MRDTLFISHATPEDNDFAIWLASRLEMLGYKTWIDKKGLLGGEKFWETIQNEIKNAVKVLFVYSTKICDSNGNLKNGIYKEWSYAESIASQHNLNDFIIPLNIEANAPYNAFIGANMINHIPFDTNWAEGLKQLLKKLEKDQVPKTTDVGESSFSEWYENEYISDCSIINKPELYYTSWWQISEIPQQFYMYLFDNREQAKAIRDLNKDISISMQSNILSSFDDNLNFYIEREEQQFEIKPKAKHSFSLNETLNGFEANSFPQHRDVENHFKKLLHCAISNLFWQKWRKKAELSSKRVAFFLPKSNENEPISFFYPFSTQKKPKRKQIFGKFEKIGFWHYAVSPQTILFPFVGFSLKSHLIFTEDGFKIISDTKKAHSYRRKKGKRFFNAEWRDLLLAFIQGLKDSDGEIKIKVTSSGEFVKLNEYPETFWSVVGYNDPKTDMDLAKIENYVDNSDEENIDD